MAKNLFCGLRLSDMNVSAATWIIVDEFIVGTLTELAFVKGLDISFIAKEGEL